MIAMVFGVVAVTGASAANFLASESGTLKGHAIGTQTFTTSVGEIKCTTAATTGTVEEVTFEDQVVTVSYSGCKIFGVFSVTVSTAEYDLHANGTVDVLNTITLTLSALSCTVKVPPQNGLGSVSYEDSGGKVVGKGALTAITYTATGGGVCASGGSNGTYTGNNEFELNGGAGSLALANDFEIVKKVFMNGVAQKKPLECKFEKVNDVCKIELEVAKGKGKILKNEWRGQEPEKRYEATVGCTPGKTELEKGQTCADEIKMIKHVAGANNEWMVEVDAIGEKFNVRSFTVLKPV